MSLFIVYIGSIIIFMYLFMLSAFSSVQFSFQSESISFIYIDVIFILVLSPHTGKKKRGGEKTPNSLFQSSTSHCSHELKTRETSSCSL